MAEFAYNNAKNASTSYTFFKLHCGYHPQVFDKENLNPCSQLKTAKEPSFKLRNLIAACQQYFHHVQELQKQAYNKVVKPRSYDSTHKVWPNSKHLKTKRNRKLEVKFLGPFRTLHLIGKQAYKLKLLKKLKIHNVFHVSVLEQNTPKKRQVNDMQLEFEASNQKEYKFDGIWNSAVYAKKSTIG